MSEDQTPRIYTIAAFVALAILLGTLSFRILKPFLEAIAWAAVLAIAFQGPWRWLERRLPRRRNLAAGIMVTAIVVLVLLPASLFVGGLTAQAADAGTRVAARLRATNIRSFSDIVQIPVVADALDTAKSRAGITPEDFQQMAAGFVSQFSTRAARLAGQLVVGAFDGLLTFLNTVFVLFFLFRDGAAMAAAVLGLVPTDQEGREALRRQLGSMVSGIFRGSLLCATIQGVVGGLGWWMAGLPSPLLAGAATGILSLLPIGGATLVWLPGSISLWLAGERGEAVFLFVWGAVVVSFLADNVLRTVVLGGQRQLSTLLVFLGVFGGLAAFGILGLFLGPVVLAMGLAVIQAMRAQAEWRPPPVAA